MRHHDPVIPPEVSAGHDCSSPSEGAGQVRTGLRRGLAMLIVLMSLVGLLRVPLAADRDDPPYPHGDFRADCELCHSPDAWTPARMSAKFDHARFGFALEGAHRAATCTACHKSLDFSQAATLCRTCHEDPHRGELSADCGTCHAARSFLDRGPMVRAHQLTSFPLTGSHVALDCETCHPPSGEGTLRFVNARAECLTCHMNEYRAASVDHVAGGFSTECRDCHSSLTWSTARVDHDRTGFPLTGAHRSAACGSCHGDGVYAGKPTDCASCHMDDYNGASPNHVAANFPASACMSCHNTTDWSGAAFDHNPFFPITSGPHAGRSCSDCHNNPVHYGDFTCLSCHPHSDQAKTDGHHREANGYVYRSDACYTCHPRGRH